MDCEDVLITDGNAASNATRFSRASEGLKTVQENWRVIQAEYWNDRGRIEAENNGRVFGP